MSINVKNLKHNPLLRFMAKKAKNCVVYFDNPNKKIIVERYLGKLNNKIIKISSTHEFYDKEIAEALEFLDIRNGNIII